MLALIFELTVTVLLVGILFKLFNGKIRTAGLLARSAGAGIEPERVQALVLSIAAAATYAALALGTLSTDKPALPEPPDWVLGSVVGSQSLYLLGKWFRKSRKWTRR